VHRPPTHGRVKRPFPFCVRSPADGDSKCELFCHQTGADACQNMVVNASQAGSLIMFATSEDGLSGSSCVHLVALPPDLDTWRGAHRSDPRPAARAAADVQQQAAVLLGPHHEPRRHVQRFHRGASPPPLPTDPRTAISARRVQYSYVVQASTESSGCLHKWHHKRGLPPCDSPCL